MSRLYTSFPLDDILAAELARIEQERKDAEAAARKERIGALRHENETPNETLEHVTTASQTPEYSDFSIGEDSTHYILHDVPIGTRRMSLILTKELLDSDAFRMQDDWYKILRSSHGGKHLYGLLSGPEFEAIVEAVAAHTPKDEELRRYEDLKRILLGDLTSRRMTSSGVLFVPVGIDGVYHDYPSVVVYNHDLKGDNFSIDASNLLEKELSALLETTPARYCAARLALGIECGIFIRWKTRESDHRSPLIVGDNLYVNVDEPALARGAFVTYHPAGGGA